MRIHVVGAGPAGLTFAAHLKQRRPSWAVTVWDRGSPDVTEGWGVVFSGRALDALAAADPTTHAALADALVPWEAITVTRATRSLRVLGSRYAAVSRLALLQVLQERCRALGVQLRYGVDVRQVDELPPAELLVGAGGQGGPVRAAYASAFQPQVDTRPNRFIWLGTSRLFDGLNLVFRQAPEGAFCAHAYQYRADTSTFIVECSEETFARAGLADLDEPGALRLLERIFAADLEGHLLLSNRSRWRRFGVVENRRWTAEREGGRVCLLGDALHTCHFSLGSGTHLAMASAAALARCLDEVQGLPAALLAFEEQRRPEVERYQTLGAASMRWFETFEDDMHLPDHAFALRCIGRTGQVDLEALRLRDPAFVDGLRAEQREGS